MLKGWYQQYFLPFDENMKCLLSKTYQKQPAINQALESCTLSDALLPLCTEARKELCATQTTAAQGLEAASY